MDAQKIMINLSTWWNMHITKWKDDTENYEKWPLNHI